MPTRGCQPAGAMPTGWHPVAELPAQHGLRGRTRYRAAAIRSLERVTEPRTQRRGSLCESRSAVSGTTQRAVTVRWVVPLTALRDSQSEPLRCVRGSVRRPYASVALAGNAELAYAELQSRTVHPEAPGGAMGSSDDPVRFFQGGQDVLALRFLESVVTFRATRWGLQEPSGQIAGPSKRDRATG